MASAFKQLAAAQYPDALGDPAGWAVLLPPAEAAVDTLDLEEVATMLARGELSLAEPWLLVWKDGDAEDDRGMDDGGDGGGDGAGAGGERCGDQLQEQPQL